MPTLKKTSYRLTVLDFLRGVAIICVVLDHVFAWLGLKTTYPTFYNFTIFSVAPLFFLAGVTYVFSFLRRQPTFKIPLKYSSPLFSVTFGTIKNYLFYFWQKANKIIFVYIIGTLIISTWQNQSFSFSLFWQQVITFPAQFYFIIIYLELLFVAPLIIFFWQFWQKKLNGWLGKKLPFLAKIALNLFPLLILALISRQFLILPAPIWLPAQQLFGGIELFIFGAGTYAGFLYAQGEIKLTFKDKLIALIFGLTGFSFLLLSNFHQQIFLHPPGFWTIVYAIFALSFFSGLYALLAKIAWPKPLRPTRLITFFGRHSLDIFIYHALFIRELLLRFPQIKDLTVFWQFFLLTLIASLASILLTFTLDQIFVLLKKATATIDQTFSPDRL